MNKLRKRIYAFFIAMLLVMYLLEPVTHISALIDEGTSIISSEVADNNLTSEDVEGSIINGAVIEKESKILENELIDSHEQNTTTEYDLTEPLEVQTIEDDSEVGENAGDNLTEPLKEPIIENNPEGGKDIEDNSEEDEALLTYRVQFLVIDEEDDDLDSLSALSAIEDLPELPDVDPLEGEAEDGEIITVDPPEVEEFELIEGQDLEFEVLEEEENNFSLFFAPRAVGMDVTNVDSSNTYLKSKFYKESPFGIAGNFHLVAFTEINNPAHTNGNILTPKLIYGSNFGTNYVKPGGAGFTTEVSYVREIVPQGGMKAGAQDNPDSYFVVGKSTNIGTAENGNAWTINGQKMDYPRKNSMPGHLWQDDTANFIDFDVVRSQVLALNAGLVNVKTNSGVTINGKDQNNQSIHINDLSKDCYVYNFKDSDFQNPTNPIKITGFNPSKPTTLTINVDMAGKNHFMIPASVAYYTDDTSVPTYEVARWSNANVIWNFYDSSKSDNIYRGSVDNERGAVTGHIIAPGAHVELKQNINGTVIADTIVVRAEIGRASCRERV